VDHVGLTELLKLTMIDYVLKLMDNLPLLYQLLILLDVVDSLAVSVWDVTVDKLELHGLGSKILELFQEEISLILLLVILIPCQNVETIMVMLLIMLNVKMLNKFHQHVELLVQEIKLIINLINIKQHLLILYHQLMQLNKI
jgi:hypothetical protein